MSGKDKIQKSSGGVRLAPAVIATAAVVLGLKGLTFAQAAAAAATDPAHDEQTQTASNESEEGASEAPAAPLCEMPDFAERAGLSPSEVEVLQALGDRREELDARAAEIDTQAALMAAAQQRLDQRVAELRELEGTVSNLLGRLDDAQEERMTNLVDVYQRMRAKDAASVFDGLDDAVLVQVASRMRRDSLAAIMGRMAPNRARQLTQMLADLARPPPTGEQLLEQSRRGQ